MWGFVWGGEGHQAIQRVLKVPWYAVKLVGYHYKRVTWAQGIGRHTKEDIEAFTHADMKTIATILGDNKFLLGDEPCLEDCALFG